MSTKQAQAQLDAIITMVQAYEMDWELFETMKNDQDFLKEEELYDELVSWDEEHGGDLEELNQIAGDYEDQDDVLGAMLDNALSCEVRSGWTDNPEGLTAEEFRIVLCTGGPHVEIMGELNELKEPDRAWIQYSDWGTPMTTLVSDGEALLIYCQQFYFGE